jgi:hypothetical protein
VLAMFAHPFGQKNLNVLFQWRLRTTYGPFPVLISLSQGFILTRKTRGSGGGNKIHGVEATPDIYYRVGR